ncbi:MAG: PEGA domain-containing protein [Planctomycetota bacterium]|nr:PEGA domain-containing protein [Planctomycetota bacterium]
MTKFWPAAAAAVVCLAGCGPRIEVRSSPPGAKILCNGKDTGKVTPHKFEVNDLPCGQHVFSVVKDGYNTITPPQASRVKVSTSKIVWSAIFPPLAIAFAAGDNWKTAKPKRLFVFRLEPSGEAEGPASGAEGPAGREDWATGGGGAAGAAGAAEGAGAGETAEAGRTGKRPEEGRRPEEGKPPGGQPAGGQTAAWSPGTTGSPTAGAKATAEDEKPAEAEIRFRRRLQMLDRLRKEGLLTEDEYREKRRKLVEDL